MSTERFEQDLADVPRAGLPESFRDDILAKACVEPSPPTVLTTLWNSIPKPIAATVAAAWVAIAVLRATTPLPAQNPSQPTLAAEPTATAGEFIAWVERHRSLSASL